MSDAAGCRAQCQCRPAAHLTKFISRHGQHVVRGQLYTYTQRYRPLAITSSSGLLSLVTVASAI